MILTRKVLGNVESPNLLNESLEFHTKVIKLMLVCFQKESYLTLYEKKLIYGQEHAKLKGLMMTDAFEEHKTLRSAETSLQFKRF